MSAQFDYVEMKENHIQDTRENQQSKDTAEKIPIIKSNERYDTIESEPTEGQGDVSDVESETLTGQVFFQLFTCNLAFFSRGLTFNSVGPTLIDLMQVASISLEQGAWLFASQSFGFLISCFVAKVIFSR
ncbi:hypothetical protein EB796_010501 [Bugula neritina]|uniref:Uncharacterized protein n=1 Tax=Bugula neritina TaxID=10212 RepID=A0A7J7JZF1_BUGNE|nr:hypothetical protein EB796_010501 [Bugula neritina]